LSARRANAMAHAMPELVLASTSPYRRQLIERLHVPYRAEAPRCDEDALKARLALPPGPLALALAREKAASLRALFPGALILGGDQLVELDGAVLGKPGSTEAAVAQLRRLRGRTHRLLTAMVLLAPDGRVLEHLDVHELAMAELTDLAIARYVERDQPLDCAGSYKIEQLGISLFERIAGEDATAIMGLPLMALARSLRALGFAVP
jgi:septum formation protein